jgi:protocatechuate 3,4-dioxygenase beta subunit
MPGSCLSPSLAATVASAQGGGTVTGRVTDETGGVLPGVTVELRGTAGEPASTVTDGSGRYEFTGVTPGTYQLR